MGSRVASGISHGSERPEWGQQVGEGSTWWDFFPPPSLPSVTLLSALSRVGVRQYCGGWGLGEEQPQ